MLATRNQGGRSGLPPSFDAPSGSTSSFSTARAVRRMEGNATLDTSATRPRPEE